ncbi:hypothetical protein CFOL_v3_06918, partial [Cephalotus follicularis]
MVCSVGSGRMAVMARVLAAGGLRDVAEDVDHRKSAAQKIHRELREADEANLLDEHDMHIFGLKPTADPLHLVRFGALYNFIDMIVCCNACKKPVKASHYAAHGELCRLFSSTKGTILEHDGGMEHCKPPRKERKKSLTAYANKATPTGEQVRSESTDADDTAASESQLDGQIGMTSSFFMDAKRNSACVDTTSIVDDLGVGSENTHYLACIMPPPTKRSKKKSGECLPLSDVLVTASGVTSNANASTYVPAPLATKIYYSQSSNRLRSTLNQLYCEASTKEIRSDMVSTRVSQLNIMSLRNSPFEQVDDLLNKKQDPPVRKPDQTCAQSSEVCLAKSGGNLPTPTSNFSNLLPVDNALMMQTAPVGLIRTKYHSKPYSFVGSSGKLIGTVQQPNGSVPVV